MRIGSCHDKHPDETKRRYIMRLNKFAAVLTCIAVLFACGCGDGGDTQKDDSIASGHAINESAEIIESSKLSGVWEITKRAGLPRVYSKEEAGALDSKLIGTNVYMQEDYYSDISSGKLYSPRYSIHDALAAPNDHYLDFYAYLHAMGYGDNSFDSYFTAQNNDGSARHLLEVMDGGVSVAQYLIVDADTIILLNGYAYELKKVGHAS
jgi:hypothetical protein